MTLNITIMILVSWLGTTSPSVLEENRATLKFNYPTTAIDMDTTDLSQSWKTIDSLFQLRQPRSAELELNKLIPQLIANDRSYDLIKAYLYKARVIQSIEQEGDLLLLEYLEDRLNTLNGVSKSILKSYLAEFYASYLNRNLYRLRSATRVERPIPEDIRSWTAYDFRNRSMQYYLSSLDDQSLDSIPIKDIEILVQKGKYSESIVNTVYDLLLVRAMGYFSNPISSLSEPVNSFDFNQDGLNDHHETFLSSTFDSINKTDQSYKAVQVFQTAISKHKNNPEALFFFDLKRLQYIKSNQTRDDKDLIYKKRIEEYLEMYADQSVYTEVVYAYANILISEGNQYNHQNPLTDSLKWQFQKAHQLLSDAIEKFPSSVGTSHCKSLIQQIEQKEASIQLPRFIQPGLSFPIRVNYKNIDSMTLLIYKVTESDQLRIQRMNLEDRKQYFTNHAPSKSMLISLTGTEDFQKHQLDYLIDALEDGYYMVYADYPGAEDNAVFRNIHTINVTHLDYFSRQNEDGPLEVWVTDRQLGSPLENATIELYKIINNRSRNNDPKLIASVKTNENGYGSMSISPKTTYRLKIVHEGSTFYPNNFYEQPQSDRDIRNWSMYMTDRSIYRPGQTVYFKGLLLKEERGSNPVIIPNQKVTVSLFDANQKIIESLSLTSDEFGSVHGYFILPQSSLQGTYKISAEEMGGISTIRVESYKRPRFEVTFDTINSDYKLGDTIRVTGMAKMYAGTPVRQSSVKVSVRRAMNYTVFPWRFRYFPDQSRDDIFFGEVTTDDNGRFEFEFLARKSAKHQSRFNPIYRFDIEAEVTDQTGESRSEQSTIQITTKPYVLRFNLPNITLASQLENIGYDVVNGAGITQSTDVKLTVTALIAPEELIDRQWETPDQFLYSESEFKSKVPHIPYKDEHEYDNWKRSVEVLTQVLNPTDQKEIRIPTTKWPSGVYEFKMEVLEDSTITITRYVKVVNPDSKQNNGFNSRYEIVVDKDEYAPEEKVLVTVINGHGKKSCVYLAVEKRKLSVREGWKSLKDAYTFEVPVTEEDYGGIIIHSISPYRSEYYNNSLRINVPYRHKKTEIELVTKRSYIEPGAKEKWTLQLTNQGQPAAHTQVLATMYDASLDAIIGHNWPGIYFRDYRPFLGFTPAVNRYMKYSSINFWSSQRHYIELTNRILYDLNRFGIRLGYFTGDINIRGSRANAMYETDAAVMEVAEGPPLAKSENIENTVDDENTIPKSEAVDFDIPVRENLNETVFFYPDIETDSAGVATLEFTMNEALTRWHLMVYAHDQSLAQGKLSYFLETKKDLMIFPNVPRFVRQNDNVSLSAKVENTSDDIANASSTIELTNAIDGSDLNHWITTSPVQNSQIQAENSAAFNWSISVPQDFTGLLKIVYKATSGRHTDAEEHIIPVLTNRMLVTETLALWVNQNESRTFNFEAIKQMEKDEGIQHHQYTLEFTDNPSWFALMALPVLFDQTHQTADAIANRFYANSIAAFISRKVPHLKEIFASWASKEELISELDKNEDLKSKILKATPWVRQAESESAQRQRIGLLFDLNKVESELSRSLDKLKLLQQSNGGFAWYPGGRTNWFTTQNIIEKLGHLDKLGAKDVRTDQRTRDMLYNAIGYIDNEIVSHYNKLKIRVEKSAISWDQNHLSPIVSHYLYVRSFFPDVPRSTQLQEVINYYLDQTERYALQGTTYQQTLGALALNRFMRNKAAHQILKSLKENLIMDEELGYYLNYNSGYQWYQVPLSAHALLIETFQDIDNDIETIDGLKRWLLKNKQTNAWGSHQNTSKAIYALLFTGMNWLTPEDMVGITISGQPINIDKNNRQAGTGYFKIKIDSADIDPAQPVIKLDNPGRRPAWGGMYWQYFQDMDKVVASKDGPFYLVKETFKKVNTNDGQQLIPISKDKPLNIGDRVTIRIELRVDRPMDFVHLEDYRPAGFEPMDVLSGYTWDHGIGFYKSHSDIGTDFYFDHLPIGNYIFEYDLSVFHQGVFTGGPASVQSYYAPSFSATTRGEKMTVK